MSKEKIKVTEEVKGAEELKKEVFEAPKYRYYCDACTNIAFKSGKI